MRAVFSSFGGITPRLSEHALPPSGAVIAHDVKLRDGKLAPWRIPCDMADAVPGAMTLYMAGCCPLTWDSIVHVAEISPDWGRMYITGRDGTTLEVATLDDHCALSYEKAGVPRPMDAPVAVATEQCGRESDARAYVYTYVNRWGEESAPSPPSNVVRVDDGSTVTVTGISSPPTGYGITRVNIYRASTGFRPADGKVQKMLTGYLYVATIQVGNTSFTDSVRGVALGASLETEFDREPPAMTGVVAIGGRVRLAGWRGNHVYFSEAFQPHNWPMKYDLTLDSHVIHMGALDSTIFVSTDTKPYIITADSCDDTKCVPVLDVDTPLPDIGCGHSNSAIVTPHGFVYSSPYGLILLTPTGKWHILTSRWFGEDDWLKISPETIRIGYWEGYLFFATDKLTFMLDINGDPYGDRNGAELATLSDRPVTFASSNNGRLCFIEEDKVKIWNAGVSYRKFIWRSRLLTGGVDAVGSGTTESAAPARGVMWSPASLKVGTPQTRVRLLTDDLREMYSRTVSGERPVRLPRVGRRLGFHIELSGSEPVEFFDLGTAHFTVNSGQ